MMQFKNYYHVLGVQPDSSLEEIRKAFRKLSMAFHPDRNQGDKFMEMMFKNINEAHEVLTDPIKRSDYDKKFQSLETESFSRNSNDERGTIEVMNSITAYYKSKTRVAETEMTLYRTRAIIAQKYLTGSNFVIALILVVVFAFLLRSQSPQENSDIPPPVQAGNAQWYSIESATLYQRPNVESRKIGTIPSNEGLVSLEETNYFIKVEVYDANKNRVQGYVRKKQLRKER
jgi:curved DNA-binding protein CbpA